MVGAALVEGRATLAEVSDEKVKDPRILKTARKVTRTVDPSFEDYRNASVTLKMKDGRTYRHDQKAALGSPELPAPREMIEEKFLANVVEVLSKKKAQAVIDAVAHLEELHRVSELMELLQKD
jgi:2-methylcitrate dehydratase PrpD